MLQSWGVLTVPDDVGGEKHLYQLFGTKPCRRFDSWHHHPLWRQKHNSIQVNANEVYFEIYFKLSSAEEGVLTFPLGV